MPIPQFYATDPYAEIGATRYRAGLIDVSILKYECIRTASNGILDYLLTSDIKKITAGQSHISNIVNENGALIDDVLVYCDGPNGFRVPMVAGHSKRRWKNFPNNSMCRGCETMIYTFCLCRPPCARSACAAHPGMAKLAYFTHQRTKLFERDVSIARGGYSGERGYEVFCAKRDAVDVWDAILAAGKDKAVMPVSWTCLDIGRVEAGLLFFPFDMTHGDTTPWEVKADWTIDLTSRIFGARRQSRPQRTGAFLHLRARGPDSEAVTPLAKVMSDGKQVGVVTSTAFKHLMKSLAMAQIAPSHTRLGTAVEIYDGGNVSLDCRADTVL